MGLYLEQIVPTEYGQQKHWLFLCRKDTYCKKVKLDDDLFDMDPDSLLEETNLQPENFEAIPDEIKMLESTNDYMRIQNLRKVYANGFEAVKGTNLKVYKN